MRLLDPVRRESFTMGKTLVFVWDNFGPMHIDRCEAVANYFKGVRSVVGIELVAASETYNWKTTENENFKRLTLFSAGYPASCRVLRVTWVLVRSCLSLGSAEIFLCHYENAAILLGAIVLRVLGRRVFVMNNSKFQDKARYRFRELAKVLAVAPYNGAMTSAEQGKAYLHFLGISESKIVLGYNSVSIARIRCLSGAKPAPAGVPFHARHYSIVARFVPKKNLMLGLEAYKQYSSLVPLPRALHLAGYGPLEDQLRDKVAELGLREKVTFRGALQIDEVSRMFATTLALVLPSVEEQFGNVVIEAQAMGLPVVISDACGAWEKLVRSGVNGFVVESDNSYGFAYFMALLSEDEVLWNRMCTAAHQGAAAGDVDQFTRGVRSLLDGPAPPKLPVR
jgi:glycosyltransferase involved in cell wall biosynthesis